MSASATIPDVLRIRPRRFNDERGWFAPTFARSEMDRLGLPAFIQDNESMSLSAGTIRGLHFQRGAYAQAKLVRCLRGAIFDVAVDIRPDSPTFGRHVSNRLDDSTCDQIYVPSGFAHGFCTLTPNTMVQYKVSAPYSPEHQGGIAWNDETLAIDWPISDKGVVISDRDRHNPSFGLAQF